MNATLTSETRHEPTVHHEQRPPRKVNVLDRAALHVGVALIKWGRRPGLAAQERRANVLERALLRNARDARVEADRTQALFDYSQQLRLR
jgi:hypothetical protein